MHHIRHLDPPRDLTPSERSLLFFLLESHFPGRDELKAQAQTAKVSGECVPGCPSIFLVVDREKVIPAPVTKRVPVEAEGADADGVKVHVLLHVVGGYLSELEMFREDPLPISIVPDPSGLRRVS